MADSTLNQATQPEFTIQRIYTKDLSFEAPNTPQVFKQDWKPEIKFDLNSRSVPLEEGVYEVLLTTTITVNSFDKMAFLIEVTEAGIFTLKNFGDEQVKPLLGKVCPTILFPYLREVVSDIVVRGGFPQLLLAPVNFDALYEQYEHEQREKTDSAYPQEDSTTGTTSTH